MEDISGSGSIRFFIYNTFAGKCVDAYFEKATI